MNLPTKHVLGSPVAALPFDAQIKAILDWASKRKSKVVCVANAHMLTEAYWCPDLGSILKQADLVTPDGMPIVWMLRLLGAANQDRVAGLDIISALCQRASRHHVSVFFLGSHLAILERMQARLKKEFPDLDIAGMEPLPFRPLTPEEDEAMIRMVNESGAGVVMVSLGCPKQEYWMAQHRAKIQAVMIGLGGAFPVYAGLFNRAPRWVREWGLEWAYRLIQEPRRLWRRYCITIPPFIWLALKQLLSRPKSQHCISKS
ncbi:MAG: WecB/TagA/CpsF family glycosyltransferase [Pseudanabaenales cyanobacterium]|nr:WecB/TagA/CpsF family glycosyltransferase [Pseudanabaenales cyanobacterium]